jgi:hypothetical protein
MILFNNIQGDHAKDDVRVRVLGARLVRFAEWWMHGVTKILYILVPNAAALPI